MLLTRARVENTRGETQTYFLPFTLAWEDQDEARVRALGAAPARWLAAPVPAPAFVALLLAGASGIWFLRRHRALLRDAVIDDDWF